MCQEGPSQGGKEGLYGLRQMLKHKTAQLTHQVASFEL